jgi:hypothetical protein
MRRACLLQRRSANSTVSDRHLGNVGLGDFVDRVLHRLYNRAPLDLETCGAGAREHHVVARPTFVPLLGNRLGE